ncbi:DUF262 domain-containing protein [Halobacillus trueperi]|uniref:DUF262 domain-containing protein n=1 Tax=Halobacillus trueperi TaxID=156205 RepID=UPI00373542CA
MKIKSKVKTMERIFSKNLKYHVARFQREYAWDKVDLKEFWEDINNNISFVEDEGYLTPEYFLGSVVFVKENEEATDLKIVDGQQRLTTIQLLFSNIVEALKGIDIDSKEEVVQDVYKFIEGKEDEKPFFRLENENTNDFLRQRLLYIDKKEIATNSDEEKNLLFAYEFFEKELKRKSKKLEKTEFVNFLIAIRDQLLNLQLIEITVDNEDEAYTIFEILNSKGHNLDNIDLIKNLIFKILDRDHPIDEAKSKWNFIKEKLRTRSDKINMDAFFRDYWLSYHGHVPKKNLYKEVRKWIDNDADKAFDVLNTMERNVELYLQIVDPQQGDWHQDYKQYYFTLKALKVFGVTTPRSLIMSLHRNFVDNNKPRKFKFKDDIVPMLEFIERFHFKFTAISSGRASGLEITYGKWAAKIQSAKSREEVMAILEELKVKLRKKIPLQQEFVADFGKLWFTNEETKDKKLIQYIFFNIERHIRQTNEVIPGENSLDHLNPQSNESLPEVGRMGNLLMVGKDLNEIMASKPFAEKKPMLKDSQLLVALEFLDNYGSKEEWSSDEINDRTNAMAVRAYNEIWEI